MKAILLGLVQCTNREHGSASNRPIPEHMCIGFGGGSSLHTVEESLYFSDNAIVGLSWESVCIWVVVWTLLEMKRPTLSPLAHHRGCLFRLNGLSFTGRTEG